MARFVTLHPGVRSPYRIAMPRRSEEKMGKRFSADGAYIYDSLKETRHFGRAVFDILGGEFDEIHLNQDDREQIMDDIGGPTKAAEVLQLAFNSQKKPYRAAAVIDSLIGCNYTRKKQDVYSDSIALSNYFHKVYDLIYSLHFAAEKVRGRQFSDTFHSILERKIDDLILEQVAGGAIQVHRCPSCGKIPITISACTCKWCNTNLYEAREAQDRFAKTNKEKIVSLVISTIEHAVTEDSEQGEGGKASPATS